MSFGFGIIYLPLSVLLAALRVLSRFTFIRYVCLCSNRWVECVIVLGEEDARVVKGTHDDVVAVSTLAECVSAVMRCLR